MENCYTTDFFKWTWNKSGTFTITPREPNLKAPEQLTLRVHSDPGVVEVSTNALSYTQTTEWRDILQDLIFDTAENLQKTKDIGSPNNQRNRWSGHLNVSWPGLMTSLGMKRLPSIYGGPYEMPHASPPEIERLNMRLMLALFIDLQNHPQLSMGILGGDIRNATPLAFGSEDEQKGLRKVIADYDRGHITSLLDLSRRLAKLNPNSFKGRYSTYRYVVMNVQHINDASPYTDGRERRIELRGFFSPLSIDEQLANYRIVMARINYLYLNFVKTDSLPPFNPPPIPESLRRGDMSSFKTHGLIHFTPAAAAEVYIKFLTEAGLNPAEYAPYLRDTIVRRAVENRLKCQGGKSRR